MSFVLIQYLKIHKIFSKALSGIESGLKLFGTIQVTSKLYFPVLGMYLCFEALSLFRLCAHNANQAENPRCFNAASLSILKLLRLAQFAHHSGRNPFLI